VIYQTLQFTRLRLPGNDRDPATATGVCGTAPLTPAGGAGGLAPSVFRAVGPVRWYYRGEEWESMPYQDRHHPTGPRGPGTLLHQGLGGAGDTACWFDPQVRIPARTYTGWLGHLTLTRATPPSRDGSIDCKTVNRPMGRPSSCLHDNR